jgi:hypothetical protein
VTLPWYATVAIVAALAVAFVVYEVCKTGKQQTEAPPAEFSLQDAQVLMTLGYDQEREARAKPGYRLRLWRNYAVDIALAAVLGLYFLCDGLVMGIVPALAHVGSQVLRPCGVDTRLWEYWRGREIGNLLKSDGFIGVLFMAIGAFLSSAFSGNFALYQEASAGDVVKAVVGGLAMGFGGMIGGGGNLFAGIGGVTSSSLDGFVWLAAAALGALIVVGVENCATKRGKKEMYATVG